MSNLVHLARVLCQNIQFTFSLQFATSAIFYFSSSPRSLKFNPCALPEGHRDPVLFDTGHGSSGALLTFRVRLFNHFASSRKLIISVFCLFFFSSLCDFLLTQKMCFSSLECVRVCPYSAARLCPNILLLLESLLQIATRNRCPTEKKGTHRISSRRWSLKKTAGNS